VIGAPPARVRPAGRRVLSRSARTVRACSKADYLMRTNRFSLLRSLALAGTAALLGAALAACASSTSSSANAGASSPGMSGMAGMTAASASASATASGMSGMNEPMYTGTGLSASASGFSLVPSSNTSALPSGNALSLRFRIEDASGMAVTAFEDDQT
jgi:hypothetical protein